MLILLVLWNSCGNTFATGKASQSSTVGQNLISLRHCGYADLEREEMGKFAEFSTFSRLETSDRLPSLPCYQTAEDVIAACKALYPHMNVTAVRSLAEMETRLGALVTFECLQEVERAKEYSRVPPVLLVPSGCKFKHLQNNKDLCFSERDWVKLAFDECGLDNLTISQHALLDDCPNGLSKGIEFVCCSLDVKHGSMGIQGYDFSDENGSDESSYGMSEADHRNRLLEPPQPVMIGDLRLDRHLDHNWIAAAFDSHEESDNKDDFVDSFENKERGPNKFVLNDIIQSSEESDEFDLSPALSVEQDRIQTALYKFLYSDLSLMTQMQRQKTIKLVENILIQQSNGDPLKQFGRPNKLAADARFLIEYGQLSIRHAVKMLDRICRKTMREGERTNGLVMNRPRKDRRGELGHKYLKLLQMLYKLETLIVTLLKSYEWWNLDGAPDLREMLRQTQRDVAQVLAVTGATQDDNEVWSAVAQTAGTLKNSFSSTTKQASALLGMVEGRTANLKGTEQLPGSHERNGPLLRVDHDFGLILPAVIFLSVLASVIVAVAVLLKHFWRRHLSKQTRPKASPFEQVQSAVGKLCRFNRGGAKDSEPRYQKVNDYEVV